MADAPISVQVEAHGARPNYRYDIIQPLMQGRVPIEGVTLQPSGPWDFAGFFDNARFRTGDFGIVDINMAEALPAIDAGWDVSVLPIFIKRKPVYNYLWVRGDIREPRDLEGKTLGTGGYSSAITVYTRGFLQHFYGVNLDKISWLVNSLGPFPFHNPNVRIEAASGPPKSAARRLLDGEVDGSTGDIIDINDWRDLETRGDVHRLIPNYQEANLQLLREHGVYTPVHVMVMSNKLARQHPELPLKLYHAFERSRQIAYEDALTDQTSYALKIGWREMMRDEVKELGEVFTHGLAKNRTAVDWLLDYCAEQGVTSRRLTDEQVFTAGTLDT